MYKIGINKEKNKVNLKKKESKHKTKTIEESCSNMPHENWSTLSNTNQEQREKT